MTVVALKNESQLEAEKDRKFVTALARGLDILSCYKPEDRLLGNQQISERTGLPKATVSRLTYTLTSLGYLKYQPEANKYQLGMAIINLGYSLLGQMDVRHIARPLMQALSEHFQGAVNLGVRNGLSMTYIDTYRSASTFTVQLDVGSQLDIASTAMGRAYLCAIPETERAVLLEQIRQNDQGGWPAIKKGVEDAEMDYREKGYCLSLGGWRTEVNAIAVPLIPEDGSEIMVFSCGGPSFLIDKERLEGDVGPRLLNLVGNVRTALQNR